MTYNFNQVEDLILFAVREYDMQMMGDDMIGYKFIGDKSAFWNHVLTQMCEVGVDVSNVDYDWLKESNIKALEYDGLVWKQY